MEKSAFSTLEKTFLILLSFILIINGLTFVYMGSKESNRNWIIEGFVYELPWILLFLFVYNDDLGTTLAGFALLFMFICILRTVYVSFTYKKEIGSNSRESVRATTFQTDFQFTKRNINTTIILHYGI